MNTASAASFVPQVKTFFGAPSNTARLQHPGINPVPSSQASESSDPTVAVIGWWQLDGASANCRSNSAASGISVTANSVPIMHCKSLFMNDLPCEDDSPKEGTRQFGGARGNTRVQRTERAPSGGFHALNGKLLRERGPGSDLSR